VATGANYFVCSFQWGDLSHAQAMRSIELFASEVMPGYQVGGPDMAPKPPTFGAPRETGAAPRSTS
jgi:hypothetical protein